MYRILSIDGGGIRGLIPAVILAHIERWAGKPLGQIFDLVAGTSTGGIIAAAVAAGVPMERVVKLYRERGNTIFSRSAAKRLASLGGLADEKYPPTGLERCLREVFQGRKLSEVKPELLIPATTLGGSPKMFKSRKARSCPAEDFLLVDVCRATSAAPTFFPPAEIKDVAGERTYYLVDGGLVANNPAMCAVTEAFKRGEPFPWLLSLGTGADDSHMDIEAARHCGLLSGGAGVLKLALNGPGNAVDCQCRELLGDQYHRLQSLLLDPIDLDATDEASLTTMEALAERLCESEEFEMAVKALGIKTS